MQADNPQVNAKEHSGFPHHLWEPSQKLGSHDDLYRLRIWVTCDKEERGDCPCQTFIFKNLDMLIEATAELKDEFEGALPSHRMKKGGVGYLDDEGRIDKGKMEALVIDYDAQNSNESWKDFMARLNNLKKNWVLDG